MSNFYIHKKWNSNYHEILKNFFLLPPGSAGQWQGLKLAVSLSAARGAGGERGGGVGCTKKLPPKKLPACQQELLSDNNKKRQKKLTMA